MQEITTGKKSFGIKEIGAMIKVAFAVVFGCLFLAAPAFAQLQKVNTTFSNIQIILAGVGVTICTIAIMFTGFKMMFQHAKWAEISNIVMGAMFIGCAAGLAAWLIN